MSGMIGAQQGPFGRVTLFDIRAPLAEHAHPHVHLLFKVEGGDRGLRVEGEEFLLGPDNCLLIGPWRRHGDIEAASAEPTLMLALYIELAFVEAEFGQDPVAAFASSSVPLGSDGRRLVTEISRLVSGRGRSRLMQSALVELMHAVFAAASGAASERSSVSDYRIRRAIAQLRESPHLHPDFHLLASSVGLSRSRFFEQFKASLGIAPTMFVDGLLVEQAIGMLVETDRPIEEISARLGFAAQSSFSRFFKDRVGFPPMTLRQVAGTLPN